jgi:hypothetical protein
LDQAAERSRAWEDTTARKIIVAAIVVICALGAGAFAYLHESGARGAATPPAPPTVPVVAGVVAQHDVPIYLSGVGTVIAYNTDVVRAQIQEAPIPIAMLLDRRQETLSWELRTTMSLARLRRDQGRVAEAHDLLMPVFLRFTEGFGATDLRMAKSLLSELA